MKPTIEDSILIDKNIRYALNELKRRMSELSILSGNEQLEAIESDYQLMLDSYAHGLKDPKVNDVYNALLHRLYSLYNTIRLASVVKKRSVFMHANAIKRDFSEQEGSILASLEHFVQDVAMATLLPEEKQVTYVKQTHNAHQRYIENVFNYILVSDTWSEQTKSDYKKLITSPTVDINDSLLIISAITLALLVVFDANKWLLLYELYTECDSVSIAQRAFVGMYLTAKQNVCLVFPRIKDAYDVLCSSDKALHDILELQIQLYYCAKTEADSAEIQREIMPTLIKNNRFNVSRNQILDKDEDALNDILNSDGAESELAEMEEKMNRMREMQKNGSDIYFGGFSQMKRFSFFYQISNWFVPFNIEHPDVENIAMGDISSVLSHTVSKAPFCDSDKYSFAFALSSVFSRLPNEIKELLLNNDSFIAPIDSDVDVNSAACVRRMYLQNLYRFFWLYQGRKDFPNPFISSISSNPILSQLACKRPEEPAYATFLKLIRFYFKHKHYDAIISLCSARYDNGQSSFDESVLLGYSFVKIHDYVKAYDILVYLHMINASDANVLKALAYSAFRLEKYDEAADYYNILISKEGEKKKYLLYRSLALVNTAQIKDGLSILHRLNYEDETDNDVKRALAWGYLMEGNPVGAERIYAQLLSHDDNLPSDVLNMGYAKWLLLKNNEAADIFNKYKSKKTSDLEWSLHQEFSSDAKMLSLNGISDVEIRMMLDLVESKGL